MESPKEQIIIQHVVYTTVQDIRCDAHSSGTHWWVHFDGSRESIAFQGEQPFEKGDKIKITFQKVTDALLSKPPV